MSRRKLDDYEPTIGREDEYADDGATAEPCPECGAGKVWRRGKHGQRDFLGCSRFPKCKWTSYRRK